MGVPREEAVYVRRVMVKGSELRKGDRRFKLTKKFIRISGVTGVVRLGCLVETGSFETHVPVVFFLRMTLDQGREFGLIKPNFQTYEHIEKDETVVILSWEQYQRLLIGEAI